MTDPSSSTFTVLIIIALEDDDDDEEEGGGKKRGLGVPGDERRATMPPPLGRRALVSAPEESTRVIADADAAADAAADAVGDDATARTRRMSPRGGRVGR